MRNTPPCTRARVRVLCQCLSGPVYRVCNSMPSLCVWRARFGVTKFSRQRAVVLKASTCACAPQNPEKHAMFKRMLSYVESTETRWLPRTRTRAMLHAGGGALCRVPLQQLPPYTRSAFVPTCMRACMHGNSHSQRYARALCCVRTAARWVRACACTYRYTRSHTRKHAHTFTHKHSNTHRDKAAEELTPRLQKLEEEEREAGLSLAGQIVRQMERVCIINRKRKRKGACAPNQTRSKYARATTFACTCTDVKE